MVNLIIVALFALLNLQTTSQDADLPTETVNIQSEYFVNKNLSVINRLTITGYSSTPEQTDNDPFITASGTQVHSGIIATNFLPFGTKIKIPEIYGDKIFTVEDRMAKKHSDKIDIWFPSEMSAQKFGVKKADIVILN